MSPRHAVHSSLRARARDLGLGVGPCVPGANNSITEVSGISVGHATVSDDHAGLGPGLTAITHPQLLAGPVVGNGFGTFTGATQADARRGVWADQCEWAADLSSF